jgi:putative nucleotidyltransferase with HDIG domain
MQMKDLPKRLKVFLIFLYIFTIASVIVLIPNKDIVQTNQNYLSILFFILFLALAESFTVQFKSMALSTSFAVQVASFLIFKPFTAIIIIVIGFSLRIMKSNNGKYVHILNTHLYKTLYNYCVLVIPILYGGIIYINLGGVFTEQGLWSNIHLIVIFSIGYFCINTFITSVLFSLLHNKSVLYFFIMNSKVGILSSLIMTPFGTMLAFVFFRYEYGGILLTVFPIILVRYTFYLYLQSKNQYVQTIDTLMHAMEARDKYTEGHSKRVAQIATMLATELKYSDIKIERLHMASLLHDVGKIGIDDNILNKPGVLTAEEFEIIKSHPEIGYNILKDIKNLDTILFIIRNHHERYDGKGYPDGKTSEELGLDVFIVQLADTIDAMSTDRPYRKALTDQEIIDEITKFSGTQFHPKVVQAYLNILEKQKKAV